MRVKFVAQPFEDQANLLDFLNDGLPGATRFLAVVAWAKRSGLSRIREALQGLRSRGGSAVIVLGIDEGGATVQGLEDAIDLFDEAYVFHDRTGATLHPKMYIIETGATVLALVGSNNLTAGGLYFNYEAALTLELDLSDEDDRAVAAELRGYAQRLIADTQVCQRLTPEILAELISDPRYGIQNEDTPRTSDQAPTESDSTVSYRAGGLFGTSAEKKRSAPAGVRRQRERNVPRQVAGIGSVIRRWSKRLTSSDAQKPTKQGTRPTGNMRLTRAGHPIDQKTYFREDFFRNANWVVRTGTREEAEVEFHVSIDGRLEGPIALMISHDPQRVAGQNNAPTFLHWARQLGQIFKETDLAGRYITLDLLDSGEYRLVISEARPGPFT